VFASKLVLSKQPPWSIAKRLKDMILLEVFFVFQVGDGASELCDTVVSSQSAIDIVKANSVKSHVFAFVEIKDNSV
jgi:hypothetical protein